MSNIFMMNEEIARGMVCFFHQKKHSYLIIYVSNVKLSFFWAYFLGFPDHCQELVSTLYIWSLPYDFWIDSYVQRQRAFLHQRKIIFILQTLHAISSVVNFYNGGVVTRDRSFDAQVIDDLLSGDLWLTWQFRTRIRFACDW
jgi:hypothetical protein